MSTAQFNLKDIAVIFLLAIISAAINIIIPMKTILNNIGIEGPAGGMVFFGGFIFILWISLAPLITKKNFSAVATSVLIPAFCLPISPWYGIVDPPWFGIYGILTFLIVGLIIEVFFRLKGDFLGFSIGGGLANFVCVIATWTAIGLHTNVWPIEENLPIYLIVAFVSGALGSLIAEVFVSFIRKEKGD